MKIARQEEKKDLQMWKLFVAVVGVATHKASGKKLAKKNPTNKFNIECLL